MESYFYVNNLKYSRLWHCFGTPKHLASLELIKRMLTSSRTNVLPINTHNLTADNGWDGMELGYQGVCYRELEKSMDLSHYVKMLNINLQTTAEDAVAKAKIAHKLTGFNTIKLEVLDAAHVASNQEALVKATAELRKWNSELIILPSCGNNFDTARRLVDLGCPYIRVMGSNIGSLQGITDVPVLEKICSLLGRHVVVDGGLGSLSDVDIAYKAGASAVLVNTMLFVQKISPNEMLAQFRKRSDGYPNQKPRFVSTPLA